MEIYRRIINKVNECDDYIYCLNNGSGRGLFMIPFREGDLDENNL